MGYCEVGDPHKIFLNMASLTPRCVLDLVMAQKDGKYLIVKAPNKPMIRFTLQISAAEITIFIQAL